MVFSLKDIKHLDVMARLDQSPILPKEEVILDLLPSKVAEGPNHKILRLCSELRKAGFERQASSLEDKFLLFKTADVHLYRVHDEDGEDVIRAAHPDGDAVMDVAGNPLGDVETIISRHKKILDTIYKMPTGKQAALKGYIGRIEGILKKAQALDLSLIPKSFAPGYNIYSDISAIYNEYKSQCGDLIDQADVIHSYLDNMIGNIISYGRLEQFTKTVNLIKKVLQELDKLIAKKSFLAKMMHEPGDNLATQAEVQTQLTILKSDIDALKAELDDVMENGYGGASDKVLAPVEYSRLYRVSGMLKRFSPAIDEFQKKMLDLNSKMPRAESSPSTFNLKDDALLKESNATLAVLSQLKLELNKNPKANKEKLDFLQLQELAYYKHKDNIREIMTIHSNLLLIKQRWAI